MSDLIERLRSIPVWMVGKMTPGWQEYGTTAYQAADEIAALRERVAAAEADAALARQGYATAYAEFDKKCRTINRLVCERLEMRKAISAFLPKNVALDNANISDDLIVPLDVTMGELRSLAILAKQEASHDH